MCETNFPCKEGGGGGIKITTPTASWKLETTKQHDPKEVLCYGRKAKKLHGSQGLCPVTKKRGVTTTVTSAFYMHHKKLDIRGPKLHSKHVKEINILL